MIGAIYHAGNRNLRQSIDRRTGKRRIFDKGAGGKAEGLRKNKGLDDISDLFRRGDKRKEY